jgi:uncharacterized repeat protein (TIGR03803 family)
MHGKHQFRNSLFRTISSLAKAALAIAFMLSVVAGQSAQGQTYQVIHNFTGGRDGLSPQAGLTIDAAGNLYGTTYAGGTGPCDYNWTGCGTVFKLKRSAPGWVLTPLYNFAGGNDGAYPYGRVSFGHDGALYGTTEDGGSPGNGCGTVFRLTPPATAARTALALWTEAVLFNFSYTDGCGPGDDLTFDESGNIYGTAAGPFGIIYKLTRSGGTWLETVIFQGNNNAWWPVGGVVFDRSGNLYGVCAYGSNGCGFVYELSPDGVQWSQQILHNFTVQSDGCYPEGGLIIDSSGNLYGTTWVGGTVFELTLTNGGWEFNTLYGPSQGGSLDKLAMDTAGNLYGTTYGGGAYGNGSVFKLTRSQSGWAYASLHDFNGEDGANPISTVTLDVNGNLYGTASAGGTYGYGVVWEITP